MIIIGWAIGFQGEYANMFEVVIQLGAIMAVVVLYWAKIKESIIEFIKYTPNICVYFCMRFVFI